MIDSHTHLFLCDGEEAELVAAAAAAGVGRILNIGLGEDSNQGAIDAAERHGAVFASVGRHPNDATGFDDAAAAELVRLGRNAKVRAVGETGLDFYRDTATPEDQ
ncbi:MAG: TatD family hydrolase, partial [Thermoleophilia bacterium]|nr:TatD family hydrolase [Thermoleophilia bacterium]